jgi:hypothetical protein
MESSFDQIEKEEDFRYIPFNFFLNIFFSSSRRQGYQEDINEILRDEAEKKRRLSQTKKRPKTSA